jgi:NADPH2 dehydrogenase
VAPVQPDLTEGFRFLELLRELGVPLVNVTAGSPYYNPHIQRPAIYPPSDGYQPPEDPLVGVARQVAATRELKARFPDLVIVGSAYSYLQEYLPHVAQALVREGAVDVVGLGRMVLSYHDLPHDVLAEGRLRTKQICRTFSDCTTAPRNGLISGCFPLDPYYKASPERKELLKIKAGVRREA